MLLAILCDEHLYLKSLQFFHYLADLLGFDMYLAAVYPKKIRTLLHKRC